MVDRYVPIRVDAHSEMSRRGSPTRIWQRFYDPGVGEHFDLHDISLTQMFNRSVRKYGASIALVFMNRRLTYRQLAVEVSRFASALEKLGVREGTRVAIQMPNLPQTVIAYYAVLSLGAQVVMTNPLYVEREIEEQWVDADCNVAIVMDYLFAQRLHGIRHRLPVKHYIIATIPEYLRFPVSTLARLKLKRADPPLVANVGFDESIHGFRQLMRDSRSASATPVVTPAQVAVIQYTGGTTGISKGAMLTHRNLSANVQQVRSWFSTLELGKEVWLGSLPFFHVFGMTAAMNFPLHVGAAILLMPDPRDLNAIVRNIAKHRVTVFIAVPAQFVGINNHPNVRSFNLSSIKACVSGSAPLPPEVLTRFERLTASKIVEGFGLTEASPVTHCTPLLGKRKVGSIGVPLPGTDAKVVDLEDGVTELAPGRDGELLIKGPQVMKGYWRRADATNDIIRDGWLHTGDIASVDEEGFFYILGRKKDMIIAGGYNIYPDEIDRVLMSHPAVREAATIGVPDARRGETVKSFVVLADGVSVTSEELVAYARKELAAYKVPREIEFRRTLPKSNILKILRRELRQQESARLADEKPDTALTDPARER